MKRIPNALGPWLIGTACRRKPCGRPCQVRDLSETKVKVADGSWVGWINRTTFLREWDFVRPEIEMSDHLRLLMLDCPQQPQAQGSLNSQLEVLVVFANRLGLHDAADYINHRLATQG